MASHLYMLSLNTTGLKPCQYEAQTATRKGSHGKADILHRFKYRVVRMSNCAMASHLYLLSLNTTGLKPCQYEAQTAIDKGSHGQAEILHRFKVTGEEKLILVVQESEANGVDTLIRKRFPRGLSVDSSTPLISYETFAGMMKAPIPEGSPVPLDNGRLIWLQLDIGYPGKTLEDAMRVWGEEVVYVLTTQRQLPAELYKVVGERKVHAFMKVPPEKADAMVFNLPLMKQMGDSVEIRTKGAYRY